MNSIDICSIYRPNRRLSCRIRFRFRVEEFLITWEGAILLPLIVLLFAIQDRFWKTGGWKRTSIDTTWGLLTGLWGRNGSMMNVRSFPVARPTWVSLLSLSRIHALAPAKSVFTLIKPSFPRLLINWSGLATNFWNFKKRSTTLQETFSKILLGEPNRKNDTILSTGKIAMQKWVIASVWRSRKKITVKIAIFRRQFLFCYSY